MVDQVIALLRQRGRVTGPIVEEVCPGGGERDGILAGGVTGQKGR